MTIFNSSSSLSELNIPSEIDRKIISFLPYKDQVILSGLNKAAYYILSNNTYFKELFSTKYCSFENGNSEGNLLFNEKIALFCNYHPNNCWKVACCVFQVGKVIFSCGFIQETTPKEIDQLKSKKNRCEIRIKEICGNFYEDPSSPIDQAWKAYDKQQKILNSLSEQVHASDLVTNQVFGGPDEFEQWVISQINLLANPTITEAQEFLSSPETLPLLEKFDVRLGVVVKVLKDYYSAKQICAQLKREYWKLEHERKKCENCINSCDASISELQERGSNTDAKLLNGAIAIHLNNVCESPEVTADDIRQAFKTYANMAHPGEEDIHDVFKHIDESLHEKIANLLVQDAIKQFVSNPISFVVENSRSFIDNIAVLFTKIPKETIEKIVVEAIEKKHGEKVEF